MQILQMFKLRQTKKNEMTFLGSPDGDGIEILKQELQDRLSKFHYVKSAYLSKVRVQSEGRVGIALIVNSMEPVASIGEAVALASSGVIPMDIYFFEHLSQENLRFIEKNCCNVLEAKA